MHLVNSGLERCTSVGKTNHTTIQSFIVCKYVCFHSLIVLKQSLMDLEKLFALRKQLVKSFGSLLIILLFISFWYINIFLLLVYWGRKELTDSKKMSLLHNCILKGENVVSWIEYTRNILRLWIPNWINTQWRTNVRVATTYPSLPLYYRDTKMKIWCVLLLIKLKKQDFKGRVTV